MSFPFGGFKNPTVPHKGRYSGAVRDFEAEQRFDEGDPDPFKDRLDMLDNPEQRAKFDDCWLNHISRDKALYEQLNLKIWALGQSHIDTAWLWRFYQTLNKAKITYGKAAWHVQHLPSFSFTYSQPVLLEWLRIAHPEVFEEIKKAVKTERFELQGGMYVESDMRMPSGEAMVRQRLYGQRYYLEHFGKLAEVEWLTDSFGFHNNIPQIVRKSGGRYFYTNKIAGNFPPVAFPFGHFRWRSHDGSEIVAHISPFQYRPLTRWHIFRFQRRILQPGSSLVCDYSTPDPAASPELGDIWPEVMIPYGIGDGGHGPQSEEIHRSRYFVEKGYLAGFTTAAAYFHKYDGIYNRLPVWNAAELYYNLHQGTLTTQSLVKRMNRRFEWALTGIQSLYSLLQFATNQSHDQEMREITRIWKDTLLMQFHDVLPGSSAPEVYDDCYDIWTENWAAVQDLCQKLFDSSTHLQPIDSQQETDQKWAAITFNGSDFSGMAPIELEINGEQFPSENLVVVDNANNNISYCQWLSADTFEEPLIRRPRRLLTICNQQPWNFTTLSFQPATSSTPAGKIMQESADQIVITTLNSQVMISKVTGAVISYRVFGGPSPSREILAGPSNRVQVFQDWTTVEQAWNLGRGYKEMPFEPEEFEFVELSVVEQGPVRWSIEVKYRIPESESLIRQYIQVYPGLPGLFFELAVDWHQHDAVIKNYFTFSAKPPFVFAEQPYSTERLKTNLAARTPLDQERWENCCQTWVVVPSTDDTWGVALINDGKYGFDVNGSTLGMTIVRGPEYPKATGYATQERKTRAEVNAVDVPPTHTDQGEHFIRYALIPFDGPWKNANFPKQAHKFNTKGIAKIWREEELPGTLPNLRAQWPQIQISAPNIELVAIKSCEDRPGDPNFLVLRLVETGCTNTTATVRFSNNIHLLSIVPVDLLELPVEEPRMSPLYEGGKLVGFKNEWRPHEIHTFLIRRGC